MPTLSVTLCNYNHGAYLRQCIVSLLRQTYKDFELIIVDDGSTDGSQDIISQFAAADTRIRVTYFEKNRGALAAMDYAWQQITGELAFSMGADDFVVHPGFFEMAAAGLAQFPQAAGFSAVAGVFSAERNEFIGAMGNAPHEGYIPPDEFYPAFVKGQIFITGTSIWRKEFLQKFGGYDFSFGPQTDFYINHALPSIHGIVFTRTAVTGQRVFEKRTNYGSKISLWESAARFCRLEDAFKKAGAPYTGMEADWPGWRSRWMKDAIRTIGA